jgi:hypothetical protein
MIIDHTINLVRSKLLKKLKLSLINVSSILTLAANTRSALSLFPKNVQMTAL